MLALIAFVIASAQTHLAIAPWTGKDLIATTASAAKFRLVVNGRPNSTVHLSTSSVANGWLAAFCTPKVCSPSRVDVALSGSGQAELQFELIREADNAPASSGARIAGDDGAYVDVPAATRH